ncbi:MAG: hypothetical protein U1E02_10060, partial [Hydrogenophaga sp.]|nr:hypothetical protein [Hydrogenophaga sp.]
MTEQAIVTITRQSGYQFLVDFGPNIATMLADEPEPLGQGSWCLRCRSSNKTRASSRPRPRPKWAAT